MLQKRESGMGIMEIMIATALMGIVTLSIAGIMRMMNDAQTKSQLIRAAANLVDTTNVLILNNTQWNTTLGVTNDAPPAPNDARVDSLMDTSLLSPVGPNNWYPLPVIMMGPAAYTGPANYTTNASVWIDTQLPGLGYDRFGRKCTTFGVDQDGAGPGAGDDNCPFRVTVDWNPECPDVTLPGDPDPDNPLDGFDGADGLEDDNCRGPGIVYRIVFAYSPGAALARFPLNPTSYSVGPRIRNGAGDMVRACSAVGGTWDGTQCNFNRPRCLVGEKMVGIDANGQYICEANLLGQTNGVCPSGRKPSSISLNGTLTCADTLDIDRGNCPAGQKSSGLDAQGNVQCVDTLDIDRGNCAAGEREMGLDAQGNVQCVAIMSGATTQCGQGEKVIGYNANGTPVCSNKGNGAGCGDGYKVNGYNASGDPICKFTLDYNRGNCPANQRQIGSDEFGNPECVDMMSGSSSCSSGQKLIGYYDNGSPICSSKGNGAGCGNGYKLNGYDGNGDPICKLTLDYNRNCPSGQYQTGSYSNGDPICDPVNVTNECTDLYVSCWIPGGIPGTGYAEQWCDYGNGWRATDAWPDEGDSIEYVNIYGDKMTMGCEGTSFGGYWRHAYLRCCRTQ